MADQEIPLQSRPCPQDVVAVHFRSCDSEEQATFDANFHITNGSGAEIESRYLQLGTSVDLSDISQDFWSADILRFP